MKSFFVKQLIIATLSVAIVSGIVETDTIQITPPTIDKITATVEYGKEFDNKIVKVQLELWDEPKPVVLATGAWSKGGFTIELPETVDAKYLEPIAECDFGIPVTFSNKNTKILSEYIHEGSASVNGYNKDDEFVCAFMLSISRGDDYPFGAIYMYADSDVNISGSGKSHFGFDIVYSLTLMKGWNIVYITDTFINFNFVKRDYTSSIRNASGLKWTWFPLSEGE